MSGIIDYSLANAHKDFNALPFSKVDASDVLMSWLPLITINSKPYFSSYSRKISARPVINPYKTL